MLTSALALSLLPTLLPQEPSATAQRTFRRLGTSITASKLVDPATGVTRLEAVDSAGQIVDLAALEQQELDLALEGTAKIQDAARQRLAAGGTVRLGVWFTFDPGQREMRDTMRVMREAGASQREARDVMRRDLQAVNGAEMQQAAALLGSMGVSVRSRSAFAPILFVEVDAARAGAVAALPKVRRIYLSREFEDAGTETNGLDTARWHRVLDHGIRGDGVRVAVCENNGVTTSAIPKVNVVGYNYTNGSDVNPDDHASGTAGLVGSSDTLLPGYARGVEILSANATDAAGNPSYADEDLIDAIDWAIDQGADIVNLSFKTSASQDMELMDRYVDYQSRYAAVSMVAAAGNEGLSSGNVTSPAKAWNAISVGNVSDGIDGDWANDTMNASSSFVDPDSAFGDREKPEVSAVGTSMTMVGQSGAYDYVGSGTSFAAPSVSGMLAAIMQTGGPGEDLQAWPEGAKAVMMAAATHNVEGSATLSDVDGAGAVNGLQGLRIVEQRQFATGTLTPDSFSQNGFYTHNVFVRAGDKCRVVLCWGSNATASYDSDALEADLDLSVAQGFGNTTTSPIVSSASYDNSYEIVEFVPQATGWHTLRVREYKFDGASEYFGLAWTQHVDGRHVHFRNSIEQSLAGDTDVATLGGKIQLGPIDTIHAGKPYAVYASFSDSTGVSLAGDRLAYGDYDALSKLSLTSSPLFPSFVGLLPFYGAGDAMMLIPDLPVLLGLPFHYTALVLDSAAPGGYKDLSATKRVVFYDHSEHLTLSDDGSQHVSLGIGFPFFGGLYTEAFVNANGNITFGLPSSEHIESESMLATGPPRIAPLWDDLDPSTYGSVRISRAADRVAIEWSKVIEYGAPLPDDGFWQNGNSVVAILHSSGRIEFHYGWLDSADALVGISPGFSACSTSSEHREVDLSHGLNGSGDLGGACFELFDAPNPVDLIGTYERNQVVFEPIGDPLDSCAQYVMTVDM